MRTRSTYIGAMPCANSLTTSTWCSPPEVLALGDRRREKLGDLHRVVDQHQLAGLDARGVEDGFDQRQELAPALIDQVRLSAWPSVITSRWRTISVNPRIAFSGLFKIVADAGEEQAAHARRGFARVDRAHLRLGKDAKAPGQLLDRLQQRGHDRESARGARRWCRSAPCRCRAARTPRVARRRSSLSARPSSSAEHARPAPTAISAISTDALAEHAHRRAAESAPRRCRCRAAPPRSTMPSCPSRAS